MLLRSSESSWTERDDQTSTAVDRCLASASCHVGIAIPAALSFAFDRAEYFGRGALSGTVSSVIGVITSGRSIARAASAAISAQVAAPELTQ